MTTKKVKTDNIKNPPQPPFFKVGRKYAGYFNARYKYKTAAISTNTRKVKALGAVYGKRVPLQASKGVSRQAASKIFNS